jgi:hypothetical protein
VLVCVCVCVWVYVGGGGIHIKKMSEEMREGVGEMK